MNFRHFTTVATLLLLAGCASEDGEPNGGALGSGGQGTSGDGGGVGGSSSSSGGSSSGGVAGGGGDACEVCADAKCGAQLDACEADAACVALAMCLEQCADEACATQCFATNAAGQANLDAADACVVAQCPIECGEASEPTPDPCESCVDTKCQSQIDACLANAQCSGLWGCYDQCQDDACWTQCDSQFAAGLPLSDAVDTCVETQCASECAG